jgi:hypothetical protein
MCPVPEMKLGGVKVNIKTGEHYIHPTWSRMTLHWTLATVKPDVFYPGKNGKVTDTWGIKGPQYIAVEPFFVLKDGVIGGWAHDFYIVGPHRLTKFSMLIAPVNEKLFLQDQGYLGKIEAYDPALTTAEEIFKTYAQKTIGSLKFEVHFPLSSNLERFEASYGHKATNCFRVLPDGYMLEKSIKIAGEDESTAVPFYFYKTEKAQIFETDHRAYDISRRLSRIVGETTVPGQAFIFSSSCDEQKKEVCPEGLNVHQCMQAAPWLGINHHESLFNQIEDNVHEGNFTEVRNILQEILFELIDKSEDLTPSFLYTESFVKFQSFKHSLEDFYNLYSQPLEISKKDRNAVSTFLSTKSQEYAKSSFNNQKVSLAYQACNSFNASNDKAFLNHAYSFINLDYKIQYVLKKAHLLGDTLASDALYTLYDDYANQMDISRIQTILWYIENHLKKGGNQQSQISGITSSNGSIQCFVGDELTRFTKAIHKRGNLHFFSDQTKSKAQAYKVAVAPAKQITKLRFHLGNVHGFKDINYSNVIYAPDARLPFKNKG